MIKARKALVLVGLFISPLHAGMKVLLDEVVNVEPGWVASRSFYARKGDIIEIIRYEQRKKGITTFLLDEDDFLDYRRGANPKHLNTYFYEPPELLPLSPL